jgi:hypothetical protein
MITVTPLDKEICKRRTTHDNLCNHIKERGYMVTDAMFDDYESDYLSLFNRLAKLKPGLINKILFRTKTILYFEYYRNECKVLFTVSNNEELERIKPIVEEVFDIEGVKVEIKKDYCEL